MNETTMTEALGLLMTSATLASALQLLGALVGFVGAVILVIVQQPTKNIGVGDYDVIYLRSPGWWRGGLGLLIAGFLIQAAGYLVALVK